VFVGNGIYKAEGLDVGRRSSLESGQLWICVAPECGRFEMLMLSSRALAGLLGRDVKLESLSASEMTIETSRHRAGVAIDGELLVERTPLRCTSHPRVLRTLVPVRP
jgi:diacylglycerol kinase family enzyme